MTHEERLAAVAAIVEMEPSQVKGWVVLVDDGSPRANVVTDLEIAHCCALVIRVAEVIVEGALCSPAAFTAFTRARPATRKRARSPAAPVRCLSAVRAGDQDQGQRH